MLQESDEGVLLPVRVTPRAQSSEVSGWENGTLIVRLKAPPVEGKANKVLVELFASLLGIRKSQVVLRSGEKSRHKILLIQGVRASQIQALAERKE